MKVKSEVKALPGDMVMVSNYRASNIWEQGELRRVDINVDKTGKTHVCYSVWVTRHPKTPRSRPGYYLYVGESAIRKEKSLRNHA